MLLERHDTKKRVLPEETTEKGKTPEARVHALRTLDALDELSDDALLHTLDDKHPASANTAIQLADRAWPTPLPLPKPPWTGFDPNPVSVSMAPFSLGRSTTT